MTIGTNTSGKMSHFQYNSEIFQGAIKGIEGAIAAIEGAKVEIEGAKVEIEIVKFGL